MSGITVPCLVRPCEKSDKELNALLFLPQKTKRQAQKIKTLSKYVQKYPSGWKKRLELAELLYERGEWRQAAEEYLIVVERRPQLIQVRLKLGKILQLMGRVEEAIAIYEQGLSLCHNQATIFHLKGQINLWRGDSEQAINAFEAAIAIEADNTSHYLAIGQIHRSAGNFLEALEAFEKIIKLQPENLVALLCSYDLLILVHRAKEAESRLCEAAAVAPDDYAVLVRRVAERLRLKLVFGEAGKQTQKLLINLRKLAPQSTEVNRLKARFYRLKGE